MYAKTVQNEVIIIYNLAKKFDLEEHCISDFSDWFWLGSSYCAVSPLMHCNALKYCQTSASLSDVLTVAKSLLKAMAVIHSESIIHADIKPENILLARQEDTQILSAKLADFGSSRSCHRSITEESPAIKKHEPHYEQSRFYRAPEVVLGLEADTAIDVWSFGCVLYEMLMGKPLFYATDCYDLLRKMIELMGLPPQAYINESYECNTYFEKSSSKEEFALLSEQVYYSRFRKIIPRTLDPSVDYTTVWAKLRNKYVSFVDEKLFPNGAAKEEALIKVVGILQSVLQWESWRRPTAADLLNHPLFKDI
jgi:serine/threonine protein kinase